jgi:hypothetical protein
MAMYFSENVPPKFQIRKAHQPSQYSQPCSDFSSVLLYLFDDVASPLIHLTSLQVCAGAAPLLFVLEKCLYSLGYSFQDLSPATRLYSRHQRAHPLPPSLFPILKFSCSCRYPISSCLKATQMARKHGVALEAEEAVVATCTATRRISPFALRLTPRKQKRLTNAPSRHGRMRKCEGAS